MHETIHLSKAKIHADFLALEKYSLRYNISRRIYKAGWDSYDPFASVVEAYADQFGQRHFVRWYCDMVLVSFLPWIQLVGLALFLHLETTTTTVSYQNGPRFPHLLLVKRLVSPVLFIALAYTIHLSLSALILIIDLFLLLDNINETQHLTCIPPRRSRLRHLETWSYIAIPFSKLSIFEFYWRMLSVAQGWSHEN